MISRTHGHRRIQRARRNHYERASAGQAGNWTPALPTKPFAEALGGGQLIAGDVVLPRQPSEVAGLNDQIGRVACARALTAARTMAMNHALERRAHCKCHRPAQATALNSGFIHMPSLCVHNL